MDITKLTKIERYALFHCIMEMDNISITDIVAIKERQLFDRFNKQQDLLSKLAFGSASIFTDEKTQVMMKPSIAEALVESKYFSGTPFELELKELLN